MNRLPAGRRPGGVQQARPADTRGQGKPAGQRLAEADQVRYHPRVLAGKPLAGTAKARVNLVQHEQGAGLIAPASQPWQELGGRDVHPATDLNRFHQHRANLPGRQQVRDAGLRLRQRWGLSFVSV